MIDLGNLLAVRALNRLQAPVLIRLFIMVLGFVRTPRPRERNKNRARKPWPGCRSPYGAPDVAPNQKIADPF